MEHTTQKAKSDMSQSQWVVNDDSNMITVEITDATLFQLRAIFDDAQGYSDSYLARIMGTPNGEPLDEVDPKLLEMEPWANCRWGDNEEWTAYRGWASVRHIKSLSNKVRFKATEAAVEHMIEELEYQEGYCKELQWAGDSQDALMWSRTERSVRANRHKMIQALYDYQTAR